MIEIKATEIIKVIDPETLTKEEKSRLIHPKNVGDKDDISNNELHSI